MKSKIVKPGDLLVAKSRVLLNRTAIREDGSAYFASSHISLQRGETCMVVKTGVSVGNYSDMTSVLVRGELFVINGPSRDEKYPPGLDNPPQSVYYCDIIRMEPW